MTIQFEKLKARLLVNPKVKAEYDALALEFEIAADITPAVAGPKPPRNDRRRPHH